jgi:hypothetical protein
MTVLNPYNTGKKLLAVLMIALLIILTSINFFVYSTDPGNQEIAGIEASTSGKAASLPGDNDTPPQGPDEKAPGNPVSISEEYLHEHSDVNFLIPDDLIHRSLPGCSKVPPVHFELIVPPPDAAC